MNINLMKLTATFTALAALAAATGCSSNTTDTGSTEPPASAPASPSSEAPATTGRGGGGRTPGTSGLIADVTDSTMQVQGGDGQTAVTWTADTVFTRQVAGSLADLTVGSCVSGMGEQGDDGTVSAIRLSVTESVDDECPSFGMGRQGSTDGATPPQGGERPDGRSDDMPTDMPTDLPSDLPEGLPSGGPGGGNMPGGGDMPGAFISGTVTAVDGDTVTVESTVPGEDATTTTPMTVSADTTVTATVEASAGDVAVGLCATAQGETDNTGAVSAGSVRLSDAVDGECGFGGPR